MFIDESAVNERTLDRKYGWSRIGTQCVVAEELKKSKKWSIFPVYTQDGYIAWDNSSWGIYNWIIQPIHRNMGYSEHKSFPGF